MSAKDLLKDSIYYDYMDSPIGELLLAGTQDALHFIGFPQGKGRISPKPDWKQASKFGVAKQQLEEYFSGERQSFDLVLAPHGTQFQLEVLEALQDISFGETCSYLDVATKIGRPKAVRAVGAANGRNPIPIVIPCHRVIGADGSLTGFGGGLDTKLWLLAHEDALPPQIVNEQASLF